MMALLLVREVGIRCSLSSRVPQQRRTPTRALTVNRGGSVVTRTVVVP